MLCSLIQDTLVVTTVHYSGKKKEYKSFPHLKTDQSIFTVHVTSEITSEHHTDIQNIHNSRKRQRAATKVSDHYSLSGLACKKIWSTILIPSDVTYIMDYRPRRISSTHDKTSSIGTSPDVYRVRPVYVRCVSKLSPSNGHTTSWFSSV